jgi:hypothetical protein
MTAPTLPQFVNGAKPSLKPRLEGFHIPFPHVVPSCIESRIATL